HSASGTATGVGSVDLSSLFNFSGTTHTAAGSYSGHTSTFNAGNVNGNYFADGATITDSIGKATATISVTPYTSVTTTYDANAHRSDERRAGDGSVDLSSLFNFSGTTHTAAGSYSGDTWTFNAGHVNGNYLADGA